VRIIAGSARGMRLATVPSGTRPVSDRAREGLFSSLGDRVEGARVLDLFAGTGALGIEALSRGAARALFIDSAPAAAKTIAQNLGRTRLAARGEIRRMDVMRGIRRERGQFDLILLDPPYRLPPHELDGVVAAVANQGLPAAGGLVVLTRPSKGYTPVIPVDWLLERRLSYGDAVLLVFMTS
jgi:16S rRNA (guanine966-N2)-methyltransferase